MSTRRKPNHRQRLARRLAAKNFVDVDLPGDDDLAGLTPQYAYTEAVQWARSQGIPEIAIERYGEAYQWAAENPEKADILVALGEDYWTNIRAGIVYPQRHGVSGKQMNTAAGQLRTWCVLKGFKYCFDWATPIVEMDEHDIIAGIREDAANDGLVPEPLPEGAP